MEGASQPNAPDPSMTQLGSQARSNRTMTIASNLVMGAPSPESSEACENSFTSDTPLTQLVQEFSGYDEVRSRLGLSTRPISQRKHINMIPGPATAFKVLQPDLRMNCDLLDSSQRIHLLQKGPVEQIILEGPRLVPKDTTYKKYSTMTGLDRNFRFALDDVPQSYNQRSNLNRIDDNP